MSVVKELAHFIRWRIVAVRYAGKLRGLPRRRAAARNATARLPSVQTLCREGFAQAPRIPPGSLAEILRIYRPRVASAVPVTGGHPFTNLFEPADITADNPVMKLAFSPSVLDVASDYFSGQFILDSIQVLFSWPVPDGAEQSQKWHKDYGDSKSFHWVAYLNDVRGTEDGPFTFVDKSDTRRIAKSPIIRRIDDDRFLAELGGGRVREFTGEAGESIYVDPAACYHFGSRRNGPAGRLAIFVTFNTDRPFVPPVPLVVQHRRAILDCARALRPDLDGEFLERLLQIK
jgi:hypothetical protein